MRLKQADQSSTIEPDKPAHPAVKEPSDDTELVSQSRTPLRWLFMHDCEERQAEEDTPPCHGPSMSAKLLQANARLALWSSGRPP